MKHKKLSALLIALFLSTCMMTGHLMAQIQYEWAQSFGGYLYDGARCVTLDSEGNVYTAGYFADTMVFNPGPDQTIFVSHGGADIILIKSDADGNYLWAKQMGGDESDSPFDIQLDAAGNIYMAGTFRSTSDFDPGDNVFNLTSYYGYDAFIAKYDPSGNFIWVKHIGGNADFDQATSLTLDPDNGNIFITGLFGGSVDFDPGPDVFPLSSYGFDAFVLKLTGDGDFLWAGQIGGDGFDCGNSIALDTAGNIILAGIFEETADFDPGEGTYYMTTSGGQPLYADGFVEMLSSEGVFKWAVRVGGDGQDWANGITVDPFNDILVTGEFFTDVDFDPGQGEYIMSSQGYDIFVWKLNNKGHLVWARQMGGTEVDWGSAITTDALGNVYSTGYFMGPADFDPGNNTFLLPAGAYYEVYISKLTRSGEFSWAMAFGGNVYYDINTDYGTDIIVDNENNVITVGEFESWVDVDPGNAIVYITAHDYPQSGFFYEDGFIHKLSQNTTGTINVSPDQLAIYPNPVKDILTVNLGSQKEHIVAEVRDITGKVIYRSEFSTTSMIQIPADFADGVYVLMLQDNNGEVYIQKFVKSL